MTQMNIVGCSTIICTCLLLQAGWNTVESYQKQGSGLAHLELDSGSFWRKMLQENGTITKDEREKVKAETVSEDFQLGNSTTLEKLSNIEPIEVATTDKEEVKVRLSLPEVVNKQKAKAETKVDNTTTESLTVVESSTNVTTLEPHKEDVKMEKIPEEVNNQSWVTPLDVVGIQQAEKVDIEARNGSGLDEKIEQKADIIHFEIGDKNKTEALGKRVEEEAAQKQEHVKEERAVEDEVKPKEEIIEMVENEIELESQTKEVSRNTSEVENGKIDDDNDDHDDDKEKRQQNEEEEEEDVVNTLMLNENESREHDRDQMTDEEAQEDIETKLQEFKRGNEFERVRKTNPQANSMDDEDENYDIMQEIVEFPSTLQETASKVADHLRPDVQKWSETSKVYFDLANQQITESVSPLVGKEYAPTIATCVSYGLFFLPLGIVIILFDHIRALLSLQKILLLVNIYLAAYFATLWLVSFVIGLEPMAFVFANNLSGYLSLQLLQALGYLLYLIMQTLNTIASCKSDTLLGKMTSSFQWFISFSVGLHYYVLVFHPAVSLKPPRINWKVYGVYCLTFSILCLFSRIRWIKRQYIGKDGVNKKC